MLSPGDNTEKYLKAQIEEIEVLYSIYGDEWKTENEADRSYSIEIKEGDVSLTLYVTLPKNYPYDSPPHFTISAPGMRTENKNHVINLLNDVYLQNTGQTVLFQWVDKIKEYLSTLVLEDDPEIVQSDEVKCESPDPAPEIIHGEVIVAKKSAFQGHVAFIMTVEEVRSVLNELKKNKKIAKATHNIFAYRICQADKVFSQDCDDDGETSAGGRLLHLLEKMNVCNVLVIVSRWFGGIHLGPERFLHINNAAQQALEIAGVIKSKKKI